MNPLPFGTADFLCESVCAMKKKYEINMTDGPLLRKMISFAFPLMLSGMLQLLFNAVDVIVVGKFVGDTALAAVGSTGALVNLIIGLFMGLSVGTNVLCAQGFGSGREKDVQETVHTSVLISLVFGVVLGIFGFIFARVFLEWMSSPADVIDQATIYLKIYFLGMPVIMLYNFASAALRAIGDTKRPMYYLLAAGVVNLVMNLFFVLVVKIGVAGVAIATVMSQALSAGLVVRCLMKEESMVHLDLRKLRIHGNKLKSIIRIGLPAGIQGIVFSISNVLIQSSINSFMSSAIAGNTAASNLESFTGTAMNAFYQTNLNVVSQNVGAKKYDRIWRCMFLCIVMVSITGFVMGMGFYTFGNFFLRFYTDNEEVVRYGLIRLSICSRFHLLAGLMDCIVGGLRGLGSSILPMIVSLTGACVFRIIWISTIFQQNHTLETLYASYPISWALTAAVHLLCFIVIFRRVKAKNAEKERLRAY